MATKRLANTDSSRKVICTRKRALHDYEISDRFEAGVVLTGTEVKSCRAGKAHLNDAYVKIMGGEAFLVGGYIAEYEQGNRHNHEPTRTRKLLLHRREIDRLHERVAARGEAAVPLSMYFAKGRVKVEFGIGKGRSKGDKRQVIKEREIDRELDRVMRRNR